MKGLEMATPHRFEETEGLPYLSRNPSPVMALRRRSEVALPGERGVAFVAPR